MSGLDFLDSPRSCKRICASFNSLNNRHLGFSCALSSLQSFAQCKVLFPVTCSNSEMHQPGPPVRLPKCISRGDKERSALCFQQGVKKKTIEELWREFFLDPSQWWDHRPEKENAKYPDFKHKRTHESLWVAGKRNPLWVEAELATIAPGTLQANIFSWKKQLSKHVKAGKYQQTLDLFQQMLLEGVIPDSFSFVPVLNACSSLGSLEEARRIHSQIKRSGCESNIYVATCLIDMYAKCGSIEDAMAVFNKMATRNVVAWSAMILGCVKGGQGQKALELIQQMQLEGVEPNSHTFVGILNACGSVGELEAGRRTHERIIQRGCESDIFVGNSLIDMYAKCGSIEDSRTVFNKMPKRTVVTWSAMILGYVKCFQGQKALELYNQMLSEGVQPNHITFVGVLSACASIAALDKGRRVHEQIIELDYESNVFVSSSLVEMYAKCGTIDNAWRVFKMMPTRDAVAWNAMIQGFARCGQGQKAVELYRQMQQQGVEPDPVTFVGILNACASIGALEEGMCVHEQITQSGCESDAFVSSSLVDMYVKCNRIESAWRIFSNMPNRDVVAWSAIILGYVKCGEGQRALELSRQMQQEGVKPNPMTFVGILNACASLSLIEEGRRVHEQIIQSGWECDVYVCNSLIDMYAKCGSIEDASCVFNNISERNMVCWNTLLGGYAMHGYALKALEHFESMSQEGVQVDEISLLSLLSACSHGGLVDEGLHYVECMTLIYSISATVKHYACLVDLLGRAGRLHEAEDLIKKGPFKSNDFVWASLLGASSFHSNLEMVEQGAQQVAELDAQ